MYSKLEDQPHAVSLAPNSEKKAHDDISKKVFTHILMLLFYY
jgi:hypothetical protein